MAAPEYTLRKRPLPAKLTAGVTVTSRLPQIIMELDAVAKMGVEEVARDIAEEARQRAPDATPYGAGLKYAIDVVTEREGSYVVAGDEDVFYGHFVEFGTNAMAAHPFLIPSLEALRLLREIEAELPPKDASISSLSEFMERRGTRKPEIERKA